MKKSFIITSMALGCLALAVGLVVAPNLYAAPSQTAQSIMVNMTPSSGAYVIGGSTTWTYTHPARTCAGDHYTTVQTGPVITCDGMGCVTAPPAPTPPGDNPGHLNSFVNSQAVKCAFFCGGVLPSDANSRTVNVIINNGPNRGHWHFTWTYTLTPTGPVDPQTCYSCEETGGSGSVNVAFCGFIAGESFVLKNGGNTGWDKKYSFTLTNDDGSSRVTDVMATLQMSTDGGMSWFDVQGPVALDTSFIRHCGKQTDSVDFCDGLGPVVDYIYDANAGFGGNSAVQSYLHSSATPGPYLAPDYTDNILSGLNASPDNFAGNDHNLCNYSDTAPFYVEFPNVMQAGDYRLHMTGTVKGNSALANQTFDISSGGGGTVTVNGCNDPMCPIPQSCPQ